MKLGKSLSELAAKLESDRDAKVDIVADTNEITMRPTPVTQMNDQGQPYQTLEPMLEVNGERYDATQHCHHQVASYTGIGTRYYDKMFSDSPALLAGNVNHWLHKPESKRRMVRTMERPDGKLARAFLSDVFLRLDNEHVAEATMRALEAVKDSSDINLLSCDVTNKRLYMKFSFPKVQGDVRVGDTVESGVIVRNCEIGLGSFEVYPFLNRLVCENGMVIEVRGKHGVRRAHRGSRIQNDGVIYQQDTIEKAAEAALLECRDAITTFADPKYFETQLQSFREAAESPIVEHPVRAVEVLAKTKGFDFTQSEQDSILERLIRGGDYSQWGMLNAVTNLANDVDDYDRASDLEVLGGKVLNLPTSHWTRIAEAA